MVSFRRYRGVEWEAFSSRIGAKERFRAIDYRWDLCKTYGVLFLEDPHGQGDIQYIPALKQILAQALNHVPKHLLLLIDHRLVLTDYTSMLSHIPILK